MFVEVSQTIWRRPLYFDIRQNNFNMDPKPRSGALGGQGRSLCLLQVEIADGPRSVAHIHHGDFANIATSGRKGFLPAQILTSLLYRTCLS